MSLIKNRNIFFIASAIFIVIGIIMMSTKGLNYGIDFTGGTVLQINIGKKAEISDVKSIMKDFDKDASIIHAGDKKEEIIIKSSKNFSSKDTLEIFGKFKEKYNIKSEENMQSESIGAAIGNEIKRNALLSIIIASIGMFAYISFRFKFDFGLAAVLSLVHDSLFMLAFYAIFRQTVDSSFIAAILTVIGYSINDTIVVFDRIRENLRDKPKSESLDTLVDKSIKQTLKRTLGTSFTTLVSLIILYILGVDAIRTFALPITVGILVGTYSSIFIASPIWYNIQMKKSK